MKSIVAQNESTTQNFTTNQQLQKILIKIKIYCGVQYVWMSVIKCGCGENILRKFIVCQKLLKYLDGI